MSAADMDVVAAASAMMSIARTSEPPVRVGQKRGRSSQNLEEQAELMQQAALHISTLEQKNAQLLEQVAKLQQPSTVLRVANTSVAQRLRAEVSRTKAALDMSRAANASLLAEITRLRQEAVRVLADRDVALADNAKLRADRDIALADNAKLRADRDIALAERDKLVAKVNMASSSSEEKTMLNAALFVPVVACPHTCCRKAPRFRAITFKALDYAERHVYGRRQVNLHANCGAECSFHRPMAELLLHFRTQFGVLHSRALPLADGDVRKQPQQQCDEGGMEKGQ